MAFIGRVLKTNFAILLVLLVTNHSRFASTAPVSDEDFIIDQKEKVVVEWWPLLVDGSGSIISSPNFHAFFERYPEITPDPLVVIEKDFISGSVSWTNDFAELSMTEEYSRAYFRSLDVYLETSLVAPPRITWQDVDDMIRICEEHAGNNPSGFLTNATFHPGFKDVILRSVSFSLLFVRFDNHSNPVQRYENLDNQEFFDIFFAMDEAGDDVVSEEEFEKFWEMGQYGPRSVASILFSKLDLETSGTLDQQEWQDLFKHLDCRDSNDSLDIEEFFQLDLILHNLASYPSEECLLSRLPSLKN